MREWLAKVMRALFPDRFMCPTCLGDGCIECGGRGDIPTRQEEAGR